GVPGGVGERATDARVDWLHGAFGGPVLDLVNRGAWSEVWKAGACVHVDGQLVRVSNRRQVNRDPGLVVKGLQDLLERGKLVAAPRGPDRDVGRGSRLVVGTTAGRAGDQEQDPETS